jgi:hypothetical protein
MEASTTTLISFPKEGSTLRESFNASTKIVSTDTMQNPNFLLSIHILHREQSPKMASLMPERPDAKTTLSASVDIVTKDVEHQRMVYRQDLNKQASLSETTKDLRIFAPFCVALSKRITIPSYCYFEEQCILLLK